MKKNRGKELAYILRHNPAEVEGALSKEGWLETKKLIDHGWTLPELEEIVRNDDKKRYEFSADKRKIRALQGHSIPGINADLVEYTGPKVVYHGTQSRFLTSIYKDGLLPGSREYVHLSSNIETAKKVALRRGPGIAILKVDLEKSQEKIYISRNGVILTRNVSPECIIDVSYGEE